jgi:hypothetical protein
LGIRETEQLGELKYLPLCGEISGPERARWKCSGDLTRNGGGLRSALFRKTQGLALTNIHVS